MKIVLTAHQFLPHHSSGTEIIALNIARELQARGHDVRVVTGFPKKEPVPDAERFDRYDYEGLPVDRFIHAHMPMGGQSNVVQGEYYNELFLKFFRGYLRGQQPDIVHFIHLGRLSSSAIDACLELGTPTVFTATDFWSVCPTNQLRLPDGTLCTGPRCGGANCVRHLAQISQGPRVQRVLNPMPDWMLGTAIWAINRGLFGKRWYAEYVRAVSARAPFLRKQARKLGRILAPSKLMLEMLTRNGMPAELIEYLPYGIDTARLTRHTGKGTQPTLRVSFTGTLYEHKGVHILTQAVQSLPKDVPLHLKLHGKFDDFPEWVARLRASVGDDPRITFCGPYKNTQLDAILADTDVLVCPSIWYENTPLVVYEASAAGVPAIASDMPGISEVVRHEHNGLLFERASVPALSAALRRLADDRALVAKLASNTVPPMSVVEHVTALEKLYAELVLPVADRPKHSPAFS